MSVLKTVALLMIEVHQFGYGIIGYSKRLVDLAPFENYTGLQNQVPPHGLISPTLDRSTSSVL